jgi:predicted acylesterase/phospholipase RssA
MCKRLRPPVTLLFLVLLVAGCGSVHRTLTVPELQASLAADRPAYASARQTVITRIAERVMARGDAKLDVLVLSGGGQQGAFGAGFLRGWSARTDPPMPRFDVVTGISTGALLAPFAFLGTPEALATVSTLYRNPDAIMPKQDAFGTLFRHTGALFDVSALKSTLCRVIDAPLTAEVRSGFADGRQMFIGTTDLDLGRGHVWDLAREIDTTAAGLDRFRSILLASAAIPGAFPPVELDRHFHSDGSVATNLLAADLLFYRDLARELRARRVPGPVTVRLWVIVNTTLTGSPQVVDVGDVFDVALRANLLFLKLTQQQTLMRFWEISETVNGDGEGLSIQLQYTSIPDRWDEELGASALFDERYMIRLQDFGYGLAGSDQPWGKLPPGPF